MKRLVDVLDDVLVLIEAALNESPTDVNWVRDLRTDVRTAKLKLDYPDDLAKLEYVADWAKDAGLDPEFLAVLVDLVARLKQRKSS